MASTGILPTYQRFTNGVPVPFSRRSFRPRERYVIFLVFIVFGFICFGTFFFLPEFRNTNGGGAAESVYRVYDQIKRAGPELLIPPPPHLEDSREAPRLLHHEDDILVDPHLVDDREKFKAKIEQDRELRVLERPRIGNSQRTSTATVPKVAQDENVGREDVGDIPQDNAVITVPPAVSVHYPVVTNGEDRDPVARERRNKVKEVTTFFYL